MDCGPLIIFYLLLTTFHVVRVSFVDEMVHGQTYGQISSNMLFSLACVSSETHNLQAVFYSWYLGHVLPGVPSRDRGNWE